jgi:hypothetical protein
LFWEPDVLPKHIGVAVGGFADPSFPAPTHSIWEESRHSWVTFGNDLDHFAQGVSGQGRNRLIASLPEGITVQE